MMLLFVSIKTGARPENKLLQNADTILISTSTPVCRFQAKNEKQSKNFVSTSLHCDIRWN